MNEVLSTLSTYVLPPLATAVVGWLVGRRKGNAEANTTELENVSKALAIYREMVTDLSEKIKRLEDHVERLEKELEQYKTKV